jgi:hypothetical protein
MVEMGVRFAISDTMMNSHVDENRLQLKECPSTYLNIPVEIEVMKNQRDEYGGKRRNITYDIA